MIHTLLRSAAPQRAVLTLALFLCASILAHAATWYVRTDGDDTNDGTSTATAFLTIQKAINSAANGDVIDVGAGTFAPTTTLAVNKEVRITGQGEGTTIIDVGGYNTWGIYITANNVTIEDLTVDGDATTNLQFCVKIGTGGPAGAGKSVAEDFTLEDVTIQNTWRTALDLNGVDGAAITRVTCQNVGNGFGMSISSSHNVTITDLTTSNCAWGDAGIFPANTAFQWNTALDGPDNIVFAGTLTLGAGSISVQDKELSNSRGTWVGTISNDAADDANVTVPASFTHFVNATRSDGLVFHNVGTEANIVTLAQGLAVATGTFTYSNISVRDMANDEWDVPSGLKIQAAIDAATAGDVVNVSAGTYNEAITINKSLTLTGAVDGSGEPTTALALATGQSGITVSASDVTVNNVGVGQASVGTRYAYGITFGSSVTNLALNNVAVDGASVGLRVGSGTDVDGLTVTNSHFDNCVQGWYLTAETAAGTNGTSVENVSVSNTTFSGNTQKGIYAEKLNDAEFDGITVANSGTDATYGFNNGIDINLKWQSYSNITIRNSSITGSGVYGTAPNALFPAAVAIKARDDSPSYNGTGKPPASLSNVLIENTVISGPEHALRFGEPGKNSSSPTNATVTNCSLIGENTAGTTGDGIVNTSTATISATCNWYGSADAATVASNISGNVTYAPYLTSGVDDEPEVDGFQPVPGTCLGGPVKVYANATDTEPQSAHGTIQSAIDAGTTVAGNVIRVDAGTFDEAITVNKQLSIIGSGSGTIIQNTAPDSTVITYTAEGSGASASDRALLKDVVISGSKKGILATTLVNYLTLDGVTIKDNTSYGLHINNTSGTMTDWYLTNCTFDANSSAIYISTAANISTLSILDCTFMNNVNSAFYVGQSSSTPGGLSNVSISGCTFTDNGTASNNSAAMYIEKLSNASISGNTFTNNGTPTNPRAMIVNLKYGSYTGVTISNNTMAETRGGTLTSGYGINVQGRNDAGSYNTNPGSLDDVYVTGNSVSGFNFGITIENAVDWNTTEVSNNAVANCTHSILGVVYGTGNTANSNTTLTVTNNSITGSGTTSVGNWNPNGGTISATCNWYGSTDIATVASKISGSVDATPFLVDGTDSSSDPGFQPAAGSCTGTGPVTSDDPIESYLTIQSAINGANTGATITASAGTYTENVNLNKEVTLTGTGATIAGITTISDEDAVLTNMTLNGSPALIIDSGIGSYTLGASNTFDAACTTYVWTNPGNIVTLPGTTVLGGTTLSTLTPNAAENYAIEDKINHGVDDSYAGIVRWNGNRLYVTANTGTLQHVIDVASTSDAIYIDNITVNENPILYKDIVLNSRSSGARRLGTNNYFVFGTTSLGSGNLIGFNSGDKDKIGVNTNGTVSDAIEAVNISGTALLTTEVQTGGSASAEFDAFTFTNKAITVEGNGTTGSNCGVAPLISIASVSGPALTSEGDANRSLKNVTLKLGASGSTFVRVTNGSIGDISVQDVRFQRGTDFITGLQPLTTPAALNDGKDIPEFLQDGADVGFGPGKVLFGQGAPFNATNVVAAWKGNDANSNSVQTLYSYSATSLNLSQSFLTRRPSRSVNNGDFNSNTVIGIPTSGDRFLQALASSDVVSGDEKTIFIVFRTPSASTTDRVIYKHGDHLNGISVIYDDQENVQFNIFNNRTATVSTFETFETAVPTNTVAIAQLYFDGTSTTNRVGAAIDYGTSTHWEAFADDDDFAPTTLSAPATLNLTSAINVGALASGKTYFEGGTQTRSTPGFTLKGGFIGEIIVLNTADAAARNDVYCYLHKKYDLGNNENGLERAIPIYDDEEIMAGQSNTVWPNPATDVASVAFTVPESQFVTITLVDALGRPVANVASEYMMAGEQIFDITLENVPSGLYTVAINGFTFNTSAPVMVRK